jgi:hypothetical protein
MSPVGKVARGLVGMDFVDASASALRMAGVLASTWDADITVFHASTSDAPASFTAELLANAHLIVMSMPVGNDTHFGAIVQVLKECVHPASFVPSSDGIVERSTL